MVENKKKGFTLIELLVVIAIIGILSSVVLASLNTARQKARDARRIADIKQIQIALELYADANSGVYPAVIASIAPTHISVVPKDPSTNADYAYSALTGTSGTTCQSYHLRATLEGTTNSALNGDADAAVGTLCAGTGNVADAAGTDPIYDVKP